jgi:hypothetical protein
MKERNKYKRVEIKVESISTPNGTQVPNQYIITTKFGTMFVSYDSNIAFIPKDKLQPIVLGEDWKYSTTTSKYRSIFLRESTKDTEKKLKEGIYKLDKDL